MKEFILIGSDRGTLSECNLVTAAERDDAVKLVTNDLDKTAFGCYSLVEKKSGQTITVKDFLDNIIWCEGQDDETLIDRKSPR